MKNMNCCIALKSMNLLHCNLKKMAKWKKMHQPGLEPSYVPWVLFSH